jgi:hypothetical protein
VRDDHPLAGGIDCQVGRARAAGGLPVDLPEGPAAGVHREGDDATAVDLVDGVEELLARGESQV